VKFIPAITPVNHSILPLEPTESNTDLNLLAAVRWPGLETGQLLSIYDTMHGALPSVFHVPWCGA
jgi:hypothetical protein